MVAVGLITESNSALAVGWNFGLGIATETDAAYSGISYGRTVNVGVSTETDSSFEVQPDRVQTAIETNTAGVAQPRRIYDIGIAIYSDGVQPVTAVKVWRVNAGLEVDSARWVRPLKLPTGRIRDSPPFIVRKALIQRGVIMDETMLVSGTDGASSDWPSYVANIPDRPDNVVAFIGTSPVKLGRLMLGGMDIARPGIQVQVRSRSYNDGWEKANELAVVLSEKVLRDLVFVGTHEFILHAWSLTSGPIPLGRDIDSSKRYVFSINGTVHIRQLNAHANI